MATKYCLYVPYSPHVRYTTVNMKRTNKKKVELLGG